MTLSPFEWIVICSVATIVIGIVGYFLKRVMNTTDRHDKDINKIMLTYVTKDELKEIRTELREENKKLAADVSEIKQNYLTKNDYHRGQQDMNRRLDEILSHLIKRKGE